MDERIRTGDFLDPEEWKKRVRAEQTAAAAAGESLDPRDLPPLHKYLHAEVKEVGDESDRTLQFVVSTADVDRDRDTINADGWDLANYLKNPVVLWAHDYSALPVAKALRAFVEDGVLKADDQFADADLYPFADTVYRMYKEGYLNAVSVGFLPTKWMWVEEDDRPFGVDFQEQEMLEHSAVPVPANPNALIEARSKGINMAPLAGWAEQVLDTWGESQGKILVPRRLVEETAKILDPTQRTTAVMRGYGGAAAVREPSAEPATDPSEPAGPPEDPPADEQVEEDDAATAETPGEGETEPAQPEAAGPIHGEPTTLNADALRFVTLLSEIRARAAKLPAPRSSKEIPDRQLRSEANFLAAKLMPDLDAETFGALFPECVGELVFGQVELTADGADEDLAAKLARLRRDDPEGFKAALKGIAEEVIGQRRGRVTV